ncbi:MAG: toast rack family protein [bacterium]|nr:toast rack family protein [bacterium]
MSLSIYVFLTLFTGLFGQYRIELTDSIYKHIKLTNENKLKLQVELSNFKFELKKGEELVDAKIKYNSASLSPIFKYEREGRVGKFYIKEENEENRQAFGSINKCVVMVTPKVTLDLDLTLGSSSLNLDLSDLRVNRLYLSTIGKTTLYFGSPNSVECDDLHISTRISTFTGKYLGNANFKTFYFNGRVGLYTLDFRGKFMDKKRVEITMGTGSLRLILPKDADIRLKLTGVNLKFINGLIKDKNGWWTSPNIGTTKKELIIHVDGGFGVLRVDVQ